MESNIPELSFQFIGCDSPCFQAPLAAHMPGSSRIKSVPSEARCSDSEQPDNAEAQPTSQACQHLGRNPIAEERVQKLRGLVATEADPGAVEVEGLPCGDRRRRGALEFRTLFDGAPPVPVDGSLMFLAAVRHVLGKSTEGAAFVRLRLQKPRGGVNWLNGSCQKARCKDCTWYVRARLGLEAVGRARLLVEAAGSHGASTCASGKSLWTLQQREVISSAFPGSEPLTCDGVRKALRNAGVPAACDHNQVRQFVVRENRKRRPPQPHGAPVVQAVLDMCKQWEHGAPIKRRRPRQPR